MKYKISIDGAVQEPVETEHPQELIREYCKKYRFSGSSVGNGEIEYMFLTERQYRIQQNRPFRRLT